MRKVGGRYVLAFIATSLVFSTPVWAQQQCLTCGSTAPAMQAYIDMTTKIMSSIQALGGKGASLGRYTVPGLFQGGIVDIPEEQSNIIDRSAEAITRNVDQKLQATASVATILFTDIRDIGRDNLMGLAILVQNQAIVRDWAKLQKIGSVLQDKIYELSLGAARQNSVTPADREQINVILAQYKQSGLLSSYTPVGLDMTYANLLFVFQKINRSFERFLAGDVVSQFDAGYQAGSFEVYFDKETLKTMQQNYKCARFGDQCAGNLKQFVTDIKAVSSENIQAVKTAGKDITSASKKLKQALSAFGKQTANFFRKQEKQQAFTAEEAKGLSREQQLLRTVYGSDFKKMQNKQGVGLGDAKTAIIGLKQAVENTKQAKAAKALKTQDAKSKKTSDLNAQSKKEAIKDDILTSITLPSIVSSVLAQTMQDAYSKTQESLQAASVVEPSDVVVYIPLLAYQLQTIRDLIGTKDTKGMLLNNLGTACELQCSNAGGTCRW